MAHLGAIFWATFVISLVACVVLLIVSYSIKRKFYPILYILSIFTYINFVAFTIDAFDLNKNWTLSLLAISAVVFIFLGVYFSRVMKESNAKNVRLISKIK